MSATTRPQRPGEIDGQDYWFLADEEFTRRVDAGDFLEWVSYVSGRRYGTLGSEMDADCAGRRDLRPRARARRRARGTARRPCEHHDLHRRGRRRARAPAPRAGDREHRRDRRAASPSPASNSSAPTSSATWCETTTSSARRPPSRPSWGASWTSAPRVRRRRAREADAFRDSRQGLRASEIPSCAMTGTMARR